MPVISKRRSIMLIAIGLPEERKGEQNPDDYQSAFHLCGFEFSNSLKDNHLE